MLFVPPSFRNYIYIAGLIFPDLWCDHDRKIFYGSKLYNDPGNYGFSGGVLCILLGICLLVRTQQIAGYLPLFLGVCILLTAVIKLQNVMDLKPPGMEPWLLFQSLPGVSGSNNFSHLNPDGKVLQQRGVLYYILIADGTVSIISRLSDVCDPCGKTGKTQ